MPDTSVVVLTAEMARRTEYYYKGLDDRDFAIRAALNNIASGRVVCVEAERLAELTAEVERLREDVAKGGPLHAERWTLDELLAELKKWHKIASGRTCVSFENLCFGASSLWHQTHRENFRKVDQKPAELSKWVLDHENEVRADFPAQVLGILKKQDERLRRMEAALEFYASFGQGETEVVSGKRAREALAPPIVDALAAGKETGNG